MYGKTAAEYMADYNRHRYNRLRNGRKGLVLQEARAILQAMRSRPEYTGHTGDGGSLYCRHGSYIGTWWGPDYMCGACEDGISDLEYAINNANSNVRERIAKIRRDAFEALLKVSPEYAATEESASFLIAALLNSGR